MTKWKAGNLSAKRPDDNKKGGVVELEELVELLQKERETEKAKEPEKIKEPEKGKKGKSAEGHTTRMEETNGVEGDQLLSEGINSKEEAHQDLPAVQEELKRVQKLADDYYARLQRLQAEFDNFRKRSVKEKAGVIKYAAENLIVDLLPIIDNFERALAAAAETQDFVALTNGVDMIYKQLFKVLEKEGVEPIETKEQNFDPNLHEAVHREEVAGKKPDIILAEFERGYRLKDKVIRYSKVKVSS